MVQFFIDNRLLEIDQDDIVDYTVNHLALAVIHNGEREPYYHIMKNGLLLNFCQSVIL